MSGKTSGEMSRAKSAQLPGRGKRNADESLRGNLQDNSQRRRVKKLERFG
jgi:hypothetical protein